MRRQPVGHWAWIVKGIAVAFTLFQLYTAAFGSLPDMRQRAVHVLFGFALVLMLRSPVKRTKPETRVPIWDILLIGLLIACCANTYAKYIWFHTYYAQSTTLDLFFGGAIVILALETGRRVIGWVFPSLTAAILLYCFLGPYIPGMFAHRGFHIVDIIQQLNQTTLGVWGFVTGLSATLLAMFIIFGTFLLFTGGGQTFINIALRLTGKYRGGPALTAVVASSMFGTISGSSVANVATTGNFTIPLMRHLGYKPEFAGGVEATASTGGQIMPPIMGAGAFVMAEILGISYLKVALAAAIPACLFYVAVFAAVRFQSLRLKLAPVPAEEMPPLRQVLSWGSLAPLFFPVAILLGFLLRGYTPATACFWGWVAACVLFFFSDFSVSRLKQRARIMIGGLEGAGKAIIELVSLAVCASIILCLINLTGLGVKFSELIISASRGSMLLTLILGAMVALILSMGIPTTGAYVIVVAVIGPALAKLGLFPLQAHLFLFYFAVFSGLTPPVCVVAFTAAAIARTSWLKVAFVALRLALIAYFIPFVFAYEPALIMMGQPLEIVLAVVSASVGAVCLGAGMMGYLTTRVSIPARILLVPGAAMLLVPGWQTDLWGIGLIALALLGERLLPAIISSRKRITKAKFHGSR